MISNYTANKIINAFRGTTWTGETAMYLSYHTAHPGRTGASECSGGSYGRELLTLDAPTNGVTANSAAESNTMPTATAKFWGLWNASTGGDFLMGGPCNEQAFTDGQTADLAIGDLDIVL
jgi:hypothetical protein